jgi:xanthine dehydrogenase accessory factor
MTFPTTAYGSGPAPPGREPYATATVVHVQRPTSARPGDSAVVYADGRMEGFVGGVCAESTVRIHALRAIASGEPVLLRILPGDGDWTEDEPGMITVQNSCLSGGALQVFVQPHLPAPRITVFGRAALARALADLGRQAGYEVNQSEDAQAQLPSDTSAVVIASLGRFDEQAISLAVAARVPYIGLVASHKRGAAVLDSLGLSDADRALIHTPAGLDIGAQTPAEIALSILAEIIAARHSSATAAAIGTPAHETGEETDGFTPDHAGHGLEEVAVPTAIDPVCGMTVAAVAASLHVEEDGLTTWFCSEGCKRDFEADPARYQPSGGPARPRQGGARGRA